MIANYIDHAANERTFLAWVRTGLAVVAFGFFLFKLNVVVDAVGGGSLRHLPTEDAGALVAVAARYAEWWRLEPPSSHEAAPALSARAARSSAMRLSRSRTLAPSHCFRQRS
jgi:hypothetical protein